MPLSVRCAIALLVLCAACGGTVPSKNNNNNTTNNNNNTTGQICQPNSSTGCASLPASQTGGKTFQQNGKMATCATDGKSWDTSHCTVATATATCTPNQVVDCGAVPPADVGGEVYVTGLKSATCSADGKTWDVSSCTPKGGAEFDPCTGTGQGDCRSGLVCVEIATFQDYCLSTCTDDASCGNGFACVDWNGDDKNKYCLPQSGTGDQCWSDNTCSNAADKCIVTAYDAAKVDYGSCTRECPSTNIGQQAGCAPNEYCEANNVYIETQPGAPACTLTSATDPCDAANGFRCQALAAGPACAREIGNCVGGILPLVATVSGVAALTNSALCMVPSQPDGQSNDYIGEIFYGNYGCGITGVTGFPAETSCQRLSDSIGFCVAFCGLDNGTELSCGTGYTCKAPALADAIFYDYQLNGANKVSCSGPTATTCAAGFSCFNPTSNAAAYYCVAASKMCVAN